MAHDALAKQGTGVLTAMVLVIDDQYILSSTGYAFNYLCYLSIEYL